MQDQVYIYFRSTITIDSTWESDSSDAENVVARLPAAAEKAARKGASREVPTDEDPAPAPSKRLKSWGG